MTDECAILDVGVDARGVATVTLNRPDKRNAMNAQMIDELSDVATKIATRADIRVVVLAGAGAAFCAGGDMRWMQDQMAGDREMRVAGARALAGMLALWNGLPKPVIGRVHGACMGGGVGLASVCDVAIGVTGQKMGLTEVRIGLVPATIGPYVVARMGAARARQVFFSGRIFEADEAVHLGLLARVVGPEALDAAIEAEVAPYLSAAPGAVAAAKAQVQSLGPAIDEGVIDASLGYLVAQWEGEEAPIGIQAFFDRKPAPWVVD